MFEKARKKAVTLDNILSGWRGAGLVPSDPGKVLKHLSLVDLQQASKPRTPIGQGDLDFSLLKSSPPDGTELRESNLNTFWSQKALESGLPKADLEPFDVVTMQFCMHYAFETEHKARTMLQNVSQHLRQGGVFIGTIPNSKLLL